MKRLCNTCKHYKENKEFNCTFYNIKIPGFDVANMCNEYITTARRKRCNRCIYLTLRPTIEQNGKKELNPRQYFCTKRKISLTYTELKHCNKFKAK